MERTQLIAGSTVRGGFYVDCARLDLVVVSGKEGPLPSEEGRYARVPAVAALVLAPLLGVLFVAVAPCLGLVRLARHLRRSTLPRLAAIVGSRRRGEADRSGSDEVAPEHDANASP